MVSWSTPAKKDLRNIYDYIADDSRFYAKKVIDELVEKSEQISMFPRKGRIVPEINDLKIREIIIYSYRLVYKISNQNDIQVLALIHCKQDFTPGSLENQK
ncbi:type II toxin-antitoxin system RelE/ParE family toxin [bacterium]|nr:type II toxin-antitoxin system RelE/ParE family toxin [bacterium]